MAKFRKKPVTIDAIQWTGVNAGAIALFIVPFPENHEVRFEDRPDIGRALVIPTLEGEMCASPGDYLIRGVKGELYPCKPDVFGATYEPVAEPVSDSDCAHCPDGHTPPDGGSQPWNASVGPERDGDGQPTTIHVARSAGAHVAESDAEWIRTRLNPAEAPHEPQPRPYTGRLGRGA
ncbi:hypothetical protein [Streptomyces sp. NPDC057877]|uniref:hypothetical protein n=1 Tax=Streptomyces sp. NPDC057877 TaxID=3346269 RepID=UPI0036CDB018